MITFSAKLCLSQKRRFFCQIFQRKSFKNQNIDDLLVDDLLVDDLLFDDFSGHRKHVGTRR
jgi:hypothetical protein